MFAEPFWRDALPFILALGYVALTPLLDYLTWRSRYEKFYDDHPVGAVDPKDLAKGASWAVDLAQSVPAMLLTTAGVVLASGGVLPTICAVVFSSLVLPFCLAAFLQRRGNLHSPEKDPHLWMYSLPQLAVAAVNFIAILVLLTL